jgi:isopentenyldiphosphate isomerase
MSMQAKALFRHIETLNQWHIENFRPFFVSGVRVGYLKDYMCHALGQWPQYFSITDHRVDLITDANDFKQASQQLDEVVHALVEQGVISKYLGEIYPITGANREHCVALLDRGAAGYFGIRTYGQHLNGYVKSDEGMKLWVARRAADRINFPNRLDNIVAGGLPHNLSLQENLIKECKEEADIPLRLVENAKATGAIDYCCEIETGLKPDTLYCYDVELPESFTPQNTDGEVAEFKLMDIQTVLNLVQESDEFKPNCNLVIIDFFIRHGVIGPEYEGYQKLVRGLHAS